MHISTANVPAIWLSIGLLITAVLGAYPSLMPRRGFSVDAVRNHKHAPNGVAAKAKAMAKFAHLVNKENVNVVDDYDPCQSPSTSTPSPNMANSDLQPVLSMALSSRMTESGCVQSKLAHLPRASTWTLILDLPIC